MSRYRADDSTNLRVHQRPRSVAHHSSHPWEAFPAVRQPSSAPCQPALFFSPFSGSLRAQLVAAIRLTVFPLSCRDYARPLQPGGGPDHSRFRLPGSHGGLGLLCGADQQGQEQAEAEEAQGETPAARAAGSSAKGPLGVTPTQLAVRARSAFEGSQGAGGATGPEEPWLERARAFSWACAGAESLCRRGWGHWRAPRGGLASDLASCRAPKTETPPKGCREEAALTKLDLLHKGYFLYLLLGKSHFKDLCYLEAKLFFLSMECSFLLFHHED